MTNPADTPTAAPPADDAPRGDGLLYPLDLVYERAGIAAPEVTAVSPEEIPLSYRSLLVHGDDMTPTLERHYGGRLVLRPLSVFTSGGSYFRRVLLVSEYAGQPVEMGAIRMELDAFDAPIRRKILENEIPFGRVVRDGRFDCRSEPTAFLAVEPNPEMMGVFLDARAQHALRPADPNRPPRRRHRRHRRGAAPGHAVAANRRRATLRSPWKFAGAKLAPRG